MNKLYLRLHNATPDFKKQFLSIGLLLFLMLHPGIRTNAQCNNTNASGSVTAPAPGNTAQINACAFAGDYSTINAVTSSTSYTVTSSTITPTWDYFTIRQGTAGGPVIAYGVSPLTWTSVAAGTYYVHVNSYYACGTQATCRTTAITNNGPCTPPVINVTPNITCGNAGSCATLTASGADTYTWFPYTGLYSNCTQTVPYTGGNAPVVYADPFVYTTYTVTGKINATGCTGTATAAVNTRPRPPSVTPPSVNMCLGEPAVKLKVTAPGNLQFCSGPLNLAVPDNNVAGVSNSVVVSDIPLSCFINGMSVTINMTHTRVGDMVFVLKAPNGQVHNLDYHLSATGGSGTTTGFVNTVISWTGFPALSSGTNPYTGTFKADAQTIPASGFGPTGPTGMQATNSNWSSLLTAINGTWTLGMYDGRGAEVGILNSWCLNINSSCAVTGPLFGTLPVWSPLAGLYSDAGANFAYTGAPVDSVWVKPGTSGSYTYQVVVSSLPVPPVSFTNSTPITIPVGGNASPYSSDVIVSGLPTSGVSVRSVVLHGVTHTSSEDIDVILQSPSGQNVILMSDVGGANAANATYTLMDAGPAMSITGANATGTYKPTNNGVPDNFPAPGPGNVSQSSPAIANFTGNHNGGWRLFVSDDDGTAGQGSIAAGFTINFDINVPTCFSPPRSVVVSVGLPLTITTQPVNRRVCTNTSAYYTVNTSASGTLTYQWQESTNGGASYTDINDGGVYSGTTTSMLTVSPSSMSMSGNYYRVMITGSGPCTTVTSAGALLTVDPLPVVVITANPLIIGPAQTTTILSTVTPNPAATYSWYHNNFVLPGAVSSSLLVNYGAPGNYHLRVVDINGCSSFSNAVTIANSFALNTFTYPNPNGGVFQVRYSSEPNNVLQRSLTVYNNWGEKIITRNFTQTVPYQKIDIDVRAHGKGLFWVEMRDANGKRLAINRVVVQ